MTDGVRSPRILVTNDDGINAPGIKVLEHIARQFTDQVWVVAPEVNHSGAGHSLTLRRPLRLRHVSDHHTAVDGTPTDCVLLALQHIIEDGIDFVLSGVNSGGNIADDVTYSGTIAACMEATMVKVPAIAFSQGARDGHPIKWKTAETFAPIVIEHLISRPWAEDVLINVNFPDRLHNRVNGIRVTRQGKRKLGDELVHGHDPRGEPYIWIGPLRTEREAGSGTDLEALREGFVSVTPIHLDMTHHESLTDLRTRF